MVTCDTEVNFNFSYVAPDKTFDGFDYSDDMRWAIALNGEVLAGQNNKVVAPTASTAKMILALAVMEKKPFVLGEKGENLTIGAAEYERYSWYLRNNGSNSPVWIGRELSEYDALAETLVVSSNNMADALAIWAFGSLEEYATYANEMLVRLGANDTKVGVDASGFDSSTTSTANDLAIIGEAVLEQEVLAEIVNKPNVELPWRGEVSNSNELLGKHGILGVKTGYIGEESGYCLVSGYREAGDLVTIAMLGASRRQDSFDKTEKLVLEAQQKIVSRRLVEKDSEVASYESWWIGHVPVRASEDVDGIVASELSTDFDEITGRLSLSTSSSSYGTDTYYSNFAQKPSFWQRFKHVFGWKAE